MKSALILEEKKKTCSCNIISEMVGRPCSILTSEPVNECVSISLEG